MLRVNTIYGRTLTTILWSRSKSTSSRNLADALKGTGRLKVNASKPAKPVETKASTTGPGTRSVPRSEKTDDQRPSLQSLIDKFRTAASTNVKADTKKTTPGSGKQASQKKSGSGLDNNGAANKKQSGPMSVRESFRMKEEMRRSTNTKTRPSKGDGKDGKKRANTNIQEGGGGGRGGGGRGGGGGTRARPNALSERAAKAASDNILHGLDSSLPDDDSMIEDDEMIPELTEGEKRYMRYQERLKVDKQKFQQNIPSPTRAPNSSYRKGGKKKQEEDVPVGIAEMRRRLHEDRMNRSQVFSGGMKKPPQNKSNSNQLDLPKKKKGPTTIVSDITISGHGISIRALASKLSIRLDELKNKLYEMDVEIEPLTEAQKHDLGEGNYDDDDRMIDADIAELVALDLDIEVKREDVKGPESYRERDEDDSVNLVMSKRAPVVCVMGHVDHGKTTLLDTLRKASVAENEAGGITQKLSAFAVDLNTFMEDDSDSIKAEKKEVVFLDTPGHAAFSTMRSHGVCATDLVVLVIAIDDGVKAQTIEALRTAKEAGCTILVALNKCDRMPDDKERMQARARILSKLIEEDLTAEEFGGDVLVTEVAAATGQGIKELVANVFLQAELMELDAAVEGQCEATVLDANLEKGRGVVADILVRWGNLKIGDPIVVDTMFGRVKHLSNDRGQSIKEAGPSTPVRLLGLRTIPTAGQELLSVENEARARKITERRQKIQDLRNARKQSLVNGSNSDVSSNGESGLPALSLFLKADGVGTLEALQKIAAEMDSRTNDVNVKIVGSGVGDITRTDVEQASTSNAAILGFNVRLSDSQTRATSRELDVSVNRENIIYRLEERLLELMQAQMPKEPIRTIEGSGIVQKIFTLNDKSKTSIAGLVVQSGNLKTAGSKGSDALMYKVIRESEIGMPMKVKKTVADGYDIEESDHEQSEESEDIVINEDGCVFTEHYVNKDTAQLKRHKDVVHLVEQGADCGLSLSKFRDWKEGDVVECYRVEWETKKMSFIDR